MRPPLGARALGRRTRLRRVPPNCWAPSCDSAPVAGAPVFAGLRLLPEPDDAKALAQHRCNALRELRGAMHGAAILTVGLSPLEAVLVRSPDVAELFGWSPPFPDAAPFHERWGLAEARTDRTRAPLSRAAWAARPASARQRDRRHPERGRRHVHLDGQQPQHGPRRRHGHDRARQSHHRPDADRHGDEPRRRGRHAHHRLSVDEERHRHRGCHRQYAQSRTAGNGDRGDLIRVRATVNDGSLTSAPVTSSPETVANSAPVFSTNFADRTDTVGDTPSLDADATDADAADTLTYSATGLPSGITISPPRAPSAAPSAPGSVGSHSVSVNVTDGQRAARPTRSPGRSTASTRRRSSTRSRSRPPSRPPARP